MLIKKFQVEGGFLQGLEANFTSGLNAIIGSRGTGKSSLVELIRYCLSIERYVKNNQSSNYNHAVQILEDGIVTLTIEDNGNEYELASTATRVADKPSIISKWPLIFSQTDIESIGLDPKSRIKIIDGFISDCEFFLEKKNSIKDSINACCERLTDLQVEIEKEEFNLKKQKELHHEVHSLYLQQSGIKDQSENLKLNNDKLKNINLEVSALHVDEERLKNIFGDLSHLDELHKQQGAIMNSLSEKPVPRGMDLSISGFQSRIYQEWEKSRLSIDTFTGLLLDARNRVVSKINSLNEQSFKVRNEIESFESGSSTINRKIMNITTSLTMVEEELINTARSKVKYNEEKIKLVSLVSELASIDEQIFNKRMEAVDKINKRLRESIKISGLHANSTMLYADALEYAFRNSNSSLKYKDILTDMASTISKKELLNIVFNQDIELVSLFLGTSKQRSMSIISALTFSSIAKILTADVEDTFEFFLLDNGEYKVFTNLSVGQRCTVILPIILQNDEQVVILDQPEDHIDNAFIAETLIPSIEACAETGQLIIVTHNANIPVLGAAKNVIHLESDGKRGFIKNSGDLQNKNIVSTISRIMEGGQDAFNIRAGFYSK
ncbi:hypothetical protein B7764_23840 (plasmid) [Pantoea ananatis]|uniref:AAA family ATPase n=1 Tax=Pantoea ananas TaxID=553 RepID=UPI000B617347|nr:AAA family ATPase [Pantoea ananatis]ASN18174.1 hypothetical protein B7764_23840 [Pantoea ananatis]